MVYCFIIKVYKKAIGILTSSIYPENTVCLSGLTLYTCNTQVNINAKQ